MTWAHTALIAGLCFALGFFLPCGWISIVVVATTCLWMPLDGSLVRMTLFVSAMVLGGLLWYGLTPERTLRVFGWASWWDWFTNVLLVYVKIAGGAGLLVLSVRRALATLRLD